MVILKILNSYQLNTNWYFDVGLDSEAIGVRCYCVFASNDAKCVCLVEKTKRAICLDAWYVLYVFFFVFFIGKKGLISYRYMVIHLDLDISIYFRLNWLIIVVQAIPKVFGLNWIDLLLVLSLICFFQSVSSFGISSCHMWLNGKIFNYL